MQIEKKLHNAEQFNNGRDLKSKLKINNIKIQREKNKTTTKQKTK